MKVKREVPGAPRRELSDAHRIQDLHRVYEVGSEKSRPERRDQHRAQEYAAILGPSAREVDAENISRLDTRPALYQLQGKEMAR